MAHYTMCNGSKLNWPKKASVSISTQNLPALGILNVLKTPYALAWSSLEIVQFITQWVLSLHGLSFSLWSLKRAEAGRPIGSRELLARPMRALHFLNSPPIVWPSVLGPSRREQGGTMPCKRQKSKKTKYWFILEVGHSHIRGWPLMWFKVWFHICFGVCNARYCLLQNCIAKYYISLLSKNYQTRNPNINTETIKLGDQLTSELATGEHFWGEYQIIPKTWYYISMAWSLCSL